jgi:hypothetical protein
MRIDIVPALSDALRRHGLSVKPTQLAHVARRSNLVGNRLRKQLTAEIINDLPVHATARLLGLGYTLTEFAAAPAGLSQTSAEPVFALGALANLIVNAFDTQVDGGAPPGSVLAPSALEGLNPCRNVIDRLVQRYYEQMAAVTRGSPGIRRTLETAIRRMYDAEILAALHGSKVSGRDWRRKSALPLVVMGFAAWAMAPEDAEDRRMAHLRWLYRLGELVGLIDDSADLLSDCAAGRANRMALLIADRGCQRAAERAASLASDVLSGWDRFVYGRPADLLARQTFGAMIWSWLTPAHNSN